MVRPRVRNTWLTRKEFEDDVREKCRAKFLDKYEVAWDAHWGARLVRDHREQIKLDRKARKFFSDIRATVERAKRFQETEGRCPASFLEPWGTPPVAGNRARRVGGAADTLARWLRAIEIGEDLWILPKLNEPFPTSFAGYLIVRFQHAIQNGGRGLPSAIVAPFEAFACGAYKSFPSDQELAVISILSGQFPDVRDPTSPPGQISPNAITVANVLERETAIVRRARAHVAPSWGARMGVGVGARRGFSLDEILRLAAIGAAREHRPLLQSDDVPPTGWSRPFFPASRASAAVHRKAQADRARGVAQPTATKQNRRRA
jgi:hypothetical protein